MNGVLYTPKATGPRMLMLLVVNSALFFNPVFWHLFFCIFWFRAMELLQVPKSWSEENAED